MKLEHGPLAEQPGVLAPFLELGEVTGCARAADGALDRAALLRHGQRRDRAFGAHLAKGAALRSDDDRLDQGIGVAHPSGGHPSIRTPHGARDHRGELELPDQRHRGWITTGRTIDVQLAP